MLGTKLRRSLAVVGASTLAALLLPLAGGLTSAGAAAGDPVVTQVPLDGNSCNGVRPTPGSENTDKHLIGGSLVPGGTATFEITYPVDPSDVAGRTTFVITDCVFIDDVPFAKYEVSFVPNTTSFVLTYTLTIPSDADLGALFCNYAKTTAAPSDSQASNRKAGPACFRIGGDIRIVKVAAGDDAQTPLVGASFDVSCETPTGEETIPPVVISGLVDANGDPVATTFTDGAYVASGVASTGEIAIAGPIGTICTVTETAPPLGYDLADPATQTLTIGATQVVGTFEDPLHQNDTTISTVATSATLGAAITDTATLTGATDDATGTITFSLYDTADCSNDAVFTSTVDVSGNGDYTSEPFTPTVVGSYYWVAAYSGDATNKPSSGACGATGETSKINDSGVLPTTTVPTTTVPTTPLTPLPSNSGGPLAVTGAGPLQGEMIWAAVLLILGGLLSVAGISRRRRAH